MSEINKPEETQHELFQEFSKEQKKLDRFPTLQRTQKPILLTTSTEQIILIGIVLILLCCFVFFLGVLRGRVIIKEQPQPAVRQVVSAPAVAIAGNTQTRTTAPATIQLPIVISHTPSTSATVPTAYGTFTKPDPTKPYTIQLVTFKAGNLAQAEAAGWRKKGYAASVAPSGDYFLVCIGDYASKADAQKDLKFFSKKYKDCFLRRR